MASFVFFFRFLYSGKQGYLNAMIKLSRLQFSPLENVWAMRAWTINLLHYYHNSHPNRLPKLEAHNKITIIVDSTGLYNVHFGL